MHYPKNKVFFDVGANIGGNYPSDAVVYLFEPTPELVKFLCEKYHHRPDTHVIQAAVSDYRGEASFHVMGKEDWGCSSLLEFSGKAYLEWPGRDFSVTRTITVGVIRLDQFIESEGIESIDYLHIDTQGSDLKVLQGMGKYLGIVKAGAMEAAVKPDILYVGQNTLWESQIFLEMNGFEVTSVEPNDAQGNECNIFFRRRDDA